MREDQFGGQSRVDLSLGAMSCRFCTNVELDQSSNTFGVLKGSFRLAWWQVGSNPSYLHINFLEIHRLDSPLFLEEDANSLS